ncbi:MAG TPA: IS481 family transposase, partial [Gaiellales bacterium]|nr:IS481 family transposase [Gaiellales bacterium]
MKLHGNAKTCPRSRRLLVERIERGGWSQAEAATAAGISERTVAKWLARWRAEGEAGLADRCSAPHRIPHRTPERRRRLVLALRRLRLTALEIAQTLAMSLSTVSALLTRAGLGRLSRLAPPEPPNRYERRRAGELLHVDVKRLGRIGRPGHRLTGTRAAAGYHRRAFNRGWEYVHVCVDDASRLAYVELLADELGETAAGFLERAVAWYRARGILVERVMSDNGPAYRSGSHALACRRLGLKHLRTRPYRPRTNGKAERFIQTLLREWAYARLYRDSGERSAALPAWLRYYNYSRPHGSL